MTPPETARIPAAPAREPLFGADDATRALDLAERIYAASLPHIAALPAAPESIARYGGAVIVAEALARAYAR